MMERMVMLITAVFFLSGCGPSGQSELEQGNMSEAEEVLTGTSWWVEDIGGAGVVDRSRSTVEFFEPGRVAGSTGCNRYTGGYEREGATLKFGVLAGTMMACPEALMNQEQRFHEAMGQVAAWRIDPRTDLLHLLDESGATVIRASRRHEDDEA